MVNIGNFDASQVAPRAAFDPLPSDWYAMQCTASALADSKTGHKMLKLEFEVLEAQHPQFKGRKVWTNINIGHPDPKVLAIAQSQLSALCRSVGVLQVKDTEQLHHKPLACKVKVRAATGEYEASNEITAFDVIMARFPAVGGDPIPQTGLNLSAPTTQPAPMRAGPPTVPPWQMKK